MPVIKEVNNHDDSDGDKKRKKITHKLKFIDSLIIRSCW